MIYKYLPILLLLASTYVQAKEPLKLSDTSEQITNTIAAENGSSPALSSVLSSGYRSGGGGGGTHFFYGIELGYASITTNATGKTATSGGFMYKGELGAKIVTHGRNPNRAGIISISVFGAGFSNKEKYTDPLGNTQTQTIDYSVIGLPISYTNMGYGREGTGFYWQLGLNTNYLYQVTNSGNTVTNQFNNLYFEPSVSFGLSTPFRIVNRHTGGEVGHGRALIGPFFQDAVTNLSKLSGINTHGYSVGIRYIYVFM